MPKSGIKKDFRQALEFATSSMLVFLSFNFYQKDEANAINRFLLGVFRNVRLSKKMML